VEDFFKYATCVVYDAAVLTPLGALMWFAVKRCNKVCQGRRWPRRVAMAVGLGFLSVALLPFLKFGSDWAEAAFLLTTPFWPVLEFNASIGFWFFILLTLAVAAAFWSTLAYIVAALVVRVTRRSARAKTQTL
jgi:hypothetical protein